MVKLICATDLLVVCIGRHQKHDYGNCDEFAPNVTYKTMRRYLKLFGSMNTKLWTKEVGQFSITLYEKMGWWALFAQHHGCRNITVWRFFKL